MKLHPIPLVTALLFSYASFAQPDSRYRLSLQAGNFIPEKNITASRVNNLNQKMARFRNRSFVLIQFESLPGETEKKLMKGAGIELLDYIPNNAYTATITGTLSAALLSRLNARAVINPEPVQKMQPSLARGTAPGWSVRTAGTVDLWISYPRTFSFEDVSAGLRERNFDITSTEYRDYRVIALRISSSRLDELAALPFIEYVQSAPKADEILNDKSEANSRANVLHSSLSGGRNLRGEGVVVGVGDDSSPLPHIDFNGRMINRAATGGSGHGLHVMGTVGGAGIMNEKYAGYAPQAVILAQLFSGILSHAPEYVKDAGMVITNNSYGNVADDCKTFGVYDLYSRIMDQQAFQLPSLQHVFAAGNSGRINCSPYLAGYSNVLGGYQTAKNVITVGNATEEGLIIASSSKGPVRDGRIKPDICAQGMIVYSTTPGNNYGQNSGTSMASPAVAGGLALLYQRYRQLNGNANPRNGLMKALLCNGATDQGKPGPDFSYGFGWMNLLRSVKMLENHNYFNTPVNAGSTNTHTLTIPPGSSIAQLKVMLYWNDSAAAVLASQALVNDLDLRVTDPSAAVHLPQLLDTLPGNVDHAATTGADHFNNTEQVVIDNPVPGTYTFSVQGTRIPLGNQHEYYLVYDTVPVSSVLSYPVGGEHFAGADSIYISWDSYGNPVNDFSLQYSIDNGANWNSIATGISSDIRQFKWFIPAVSSSQVRVKLIHNGTGIENISEAFTILAVPIIALSSIQCEGYISLTWGAITGATDYEVTMLRGEDMAPVATTTSTQYMIGGLSKDSIYYVSVRARINGQAGRRAVAIARQPNNGSCAGTISDKDLKVDAILSPASSGRKFTSTELSGSTNIRIRIRNLDNVATTGTIPVSYRIGNNAPVNEVLPTPAIPAGGNYIYTFAAPADMSAIGSYDLKVAVSYPGDPVTANDTVTAQYRQLDNPVIDLVTGFLDDMEVAPIQEYNFAQIGLAGLDRYDFISSNKLGRVRSFVNTGIAYSGSKALTLDANYSAGGSVDSLTGTFNLQGYDAAMDDIRLDFMFKQHGQRANAADKVWIRGNDSQPWIQAYDLFANQPDAGIYKRSASLELSDLLVGHGQLFSPSFQVRWGQWGQLLTSDNQAGSGYTFDDIRLYRVSNDIQMVSIDTPIVAGCGLGNTVPVRITLRNSANTSIANIPVKFNVDEGAVVSEATGTVGGNETVSFTFSATADLSATGIHTVKAWIDLPADNYPLNDTVIIILNNSPVVMAFPYLENFEAGDGSWYARGKNSSWQYGSPASSKINRAASGSKAWKTGLAGNYNDAEQSFLYSPCFDLSGMTTPTLSLSIALDLEDCGSSQCDAAFVEYSADGKTWTRLGATGVGTNWYNRNYGGNNVWSIQDYTRWHVATIPLPTGLSRMRLRFGLLSDPYVSKEGIAIDDIHIYDRHYPIYDAPPATSVSVTQPAVSGNDWIDFIADGQLIAAINPKGQQLGNTDAQVFINTDPVRNYNSQYYHNRNITIKPATKGLPDSAMVRFYFLDSETEDLLDATGCATCGKPSTAYELGVAKYSDPVAENGSLLDNPGTNWLFINPASVAKVPYDKGYYAEFNVKRFSEFWLSKERLDNNAPPSSQLSEFAAHRSGANDVLLEWTTGSEFNIDVFQIEVARGNDEFRQNKFVQIGEATSQGNAIIEQRYTYIDAENNKTGVRYYRLKTVAIDGSFTYSEVRPVVFTEELNWQVYPNPSSNVFNLVYQFNDGETIGVTVHDINGRLVRQLQLVTNGFVQKTPVDLSGYAAGLYLLEIKAGERKRLFRLLKQ